jgi:hypothetical protein
MQSFADQHCSRGKLAWVAVVLEAAVWVEGSLRMCVQEKRCCERVGAGSELEVDSEVSCDRIGTVSEPEQMRVVSNIDARLGT